MIITIVGGGSTFTPGIVKSIALRQKDLGVNEIRLFDNDGVRQEKVAVVVDWLLKDMDSPIKLTVTTDKETAYTDAKFIFSQMRVGKYEMREQDEKIPLRHGLVGQETCGTGGLAYGLRTIFPMMQVIDDVEKYAAKDHWILNYSNPAAVVSEACRVLRPDARIINICDMPIAILEMVGQCVDAPYLEMDVDYFGLNHFGWFTRIEYEGRDIIKEIREYTKETGIMLPKKHIEAIARNMESENRHANQSWIKVWTNEARIMELLPDYLPNTYLTYYLMAKESVEGSDVNFTRANEVMNTREKTLFEGIDRYVETGEISSDAFYAGAHGNFIADLAVALMSDTKTKFIIIEENNGNIPNLQDDAMVELPAWISKDGPEIIGRGPIDTFYKGMIEQQLASEKLAVQAAIEGSYTKMLQAFSMNKTVPSLEVAKLILDEMIIANKGYWPVLK
ncbi:MAG: 6-phospho-alpha-glucosidase [Erysipelothrix sp.]|nr:6-phospho-alpha-glucosidase [Erysipelothrix sp.]